MNARVWRWYLAAVLIGTGAYFQLPRGGLAQGLVYVGVSLAAAVALWVGIRKNRPPRRVGWYLLAVGTSVYAAANAVWSLSAVAFNVALPFPSVADGLFLSGYALMLAGLTTLLPRRRAHGDRAALLDIAIITIGLGVIWWVLIIGPSLDATGLSPLARGVAIAYPLTDVLLVSVAVRLLVVSKMRSAASWFLAAFILAQLLADTTYGLALLRDSFYFGSPMFAGWMISYGLLGSLALHPSCRDLSTPAVEGDRTLSPWRVPSLAAATLVVPVALLIEASRGTLDDVAVLAALFAVLTLLVFARMRGLMVWLKRSEQSSRRLAAIVESSDDAIISKTLDGTITSWNRGAERVYGFSANEIVGRNISILVPSGASNDVPAILKRIHQGEHIHPYETVRARKDGSPINVSLAISPIKDERGSVTGASAIARDITERKQAELEIQRSFQRLDSLHAIDQAILAGKTASEFAAATLARLRRLTFADRASISRHDREAGTVTLLAVDPLEGTPGPAVGESLPLSDGPSLALLRAGGVMVVDDVGKLPKGPLVAQSLAGGLRSWLCAPLTDANDELIGVVSLFWARVGGGDAAAQEVLLEITNQLAVATRHSQLKEEAESHAQNLERTVTELRRVNEQRERLLSRLVVAQEEERGRIASDIHDDSLQKVAAAAMRLDLLESIHPDLTADEGFAKAQRTLRRSIESMRHLMFELRPYVLDNDGLVPALRLSLDEEAKLEGSPDYHLHARLRTEPRTHTRTVLYRVAQEALVNVRKHARASRVDVYVDERDIGYVVRIVDDGIGFEAGDRPRSPEGHVGVTSMRERTELAGGAFSIESSPGRGTVVEFSLPDHERHVREAV